MSRPREISYGGSTLVMTSQTSAPSATGAPVFWVLEDSAEDFGALQRVFSSAEPLAALVRWENGESVVDALSAAANLPDLLVVDLNLPGIDGAEVIRRVRASPDHRLRTLPICVLTSSARPQDRQRCEEAGANEYRVKPRRAAELRILVDHMRRLADQP